MMRREAALALRSRGGSPLLPLVIVGGERPTAVIAMRGVDPDRPRRSFAELVMLAAAFRPSRVVVGAALPDAPDGRRGLLLAHDLQVVADGVVEMLRAWGWRRLVGRVVWLPAEVRCWQVLDSLSAEVARAVIDERPDEFEPAMLHALLCRSRAAGHRVLLAPAGALPA